MAELSTRASLTPPILTLPAPAKLNLFLHITGRRDDGYHDLQTLFQLLDFGDLLHFRAAEPGELAVIVSPDSGLDSTQNSTQSMIPTEDNLVYQAAMALRAASYAQSSQDHPAPGVAIEIIKRLPMGGGLGGGSSDAATTLVGLNRIWQLDLSTDELCQIGAKLGADIPVFVRGHSAWAEGIGDQLTPVELPSCWYVVIKPDCSVSTAAIFQDQELTRHTCPITIRAFFDRHASGTQHPAVSNDCQAVTERLYPEVAEARHWLTGRAFARHTRMTGTGACVFAEIESREQGERALAEMPEHWFGFVARGVNRSPLYR